MKYIIGRAIGVAIYFSVLVLFVEIIKISPVLSTALATLLTSAYLYLVSYEWVFTSHKRDHAYSLPRFIGIEILTLFMNSGLMYLVVDLFRWNYLLGVILGAVFLPLTNFILNYFWAFNKK